MGRLRQNERVNREIESADAAKQPGAVSARPSLDLPQSLGNRALARLLQPSPPRGVQSRAYSSPDLAQRITAKPSVSAAPLIIQPKLTVNTPGDSYEQEADRIAEHVMRKSDPQVQRKCACTDGGCGACRNKGAAREVVQTKQIQPSGNGQTSAPPIVNEVLRSSGQALDRTTRDFMEPRFGHDFSGVRVHHDTQASLSADIVGAYAYTIGRDIVFRSGAYAPGTDAGRRLLAHELTHVVQQSGASETANGGRQQGMAISRSLHPLVQRQVKTSIVNTPPSDSAINALTSDPKRMGLAWPESVGVTITARRSLDRFASQKEDDSMGKLEPVWRAHVTDLVGRYSVQTRLLPGPPQQQEVSRNLGDGTTTKKNFCAQVTELNDLGHFPGVWYMLAAVKAHEKVHVSHFQKALNRAVPKIKKRFTSFIEATRVSAPGKNARKISRAEAVGRIEKNGVFDTALWQARADWKKEADKLVEGDHTVPTAKAEHEVVDPIVRHICKYANGALRQEKGWGKCPACPS